MKEIYLSKNSRSLGSVVSLVDDEDYENLNKYNWCVNNSRGIDYARRIDTITKKIIWMHREIMNTPDNMECDHAFHNGLDNRKFIEVDGILKPNLRNCSHAQNTTNRIYKGSTGYRGVSYHKRDKKFRVQISVNNKIKNFNNFTDPILAAKYYDKLALKYHGEFAILNFNI